MAKLFQEFGGTAKDRRNEADRIISLLLESGEDLIRMTRTEQDFVSQMEDGRSVTPKQLFWLRDIKDKYL